MKFRLNLSSIITRLTLFGIVVVVCGTIARIIVLGDFLRKDVTELTSAQLRTLANYVAYEVDENIIQRREFLERLAETLPPALLGDPRRLGQWLGEHHEVNPLFTFGLSMLDTSGNVLAGYPVLSDRIVESFVDRDYFQLALKGEFAIGRPVMGRFSKVPELPMAIPLRDRAGKVSAVLVGVTAFDDPNFDSLHKEHVGTVGGLMLVSPRDKLIVAATDASMVFKQTPHEGEHPMYDKIMSGFQGSGITINTRNFEELVGVASVPSSGWIVMATLPTSEALVPITRLQHFMLRNMAGATVVILLFFVVGLRYLLRPLKNAAQHADRMTRGEIPFEPLQVVRNDEVGHLTTAFNRVLSKLLESRSELQHIAHHDPLTGLPNRQLLADRMGQALARAQRSEGWVAVLFLDLDGFKPINDKFGHEAGDAALREVADRLRDVVRLEDTLARVGGDEFVILLSDLNTHAKDAAELVANKCLLVFQQPFVIRDHTCKLGTSIGIAIGNSECVAEKLLIAADQAMYRAKEMGRGKFCWANECEVCLAEGQQFACGVHPLGKKLSANNPV